MTVAQLIEDLSKLPQDAEVVPSNDNTPSGAFARAVCEIDLIGQYSHPTGRGVVILR